MASALARHDVDPGWPLPPAIPRALAAWGRVARRAEDVARAGLAARIAEDGNKAFGGSRLTGDGFPLEIAVSTGDARLRLTLEPGSRQLDPRRRLDVALTAIKAIAGHPVDSGELDRIRRLHQAGEGGLRYGAWVGCRIDEHATAAKLYAELPRAVEPGLLPSLRPLLNDRPAVPCMIGIPAGSNAVELYWRLPSLRPTELPAVLAPAGLENEAPRLLDVLTEAYGHHIEGRLPGASVGVSYALASGQVSVTLFLFARAVWGSDARIRSGFVRAAGAAACRGPYCTATEPFAGRETWATWHGLLGITPTHGTCPLFTLGFRPVMP